MSLKIGIQSPVISIEDEENIMNDVFLHQKNLHLLQKYSFLRIYTFFFMKKLYPAFVPSYFDITEMNKQLDDLSLNSNNFPSLNILHFQYLLSSLPKCCQREMIATLLPFLCNIISSEQSIEFVDIPTEIFSLLQDFFYTYSIPLSSDETLKKISISSSSLPLFHDSIGFRLNTKKTFQLEILTSFIRCRKNKYYNLDFFSFLQDMHASQSFSDDIILFDRLPCFALPILNIEHLSYPCEVADIQVHKTQSFLANGIVAHNCMISHGVSRFLRERLFDVSDYFEINTCICGNIPHSSTICNVCGSKNIVKVALPFACKLLFQELMALGIKIDIKPKIININ
jgi:hypothetical protein